MTHDGEHPGTEHRPTLSEAEMTALFEPRGWDDRYAGEGDVWSGDPNAQLVSLVSPLAAGSALDMGCGEGGDVIWLARHGWRVTGADFSARGLARAAARAERAGVAQRTDWWQVDARTFAAGARSFDLVTSHFLHPPDGGMVEVARRLAEAVAPGGHLLIVGHAPDRSAAHAGDAHRRAMFLARDLLPGLPADFDALVVDQRSRAGRHGPASDSTLLARRRALSSAAHESITPATREPSPPGSPRRDRSAGGRSR